MIAARPPDGDRSAARRGGGKPVGLARWSRASLRRTLVLALLGGMLVASGAALWSAWRTATRAADAAYDRSLAGAIKAIDANITTAGGGLGVELPYPMLEFFQLTSGGAVYFRVATEDGLVEIGNTDLPPPGPDLPTGRPRFRNASYYGEPIRLGSYARELKPPLAGHEGRPRVVVQVAESMGPRHEFRRALLLEAGAQVVAIERDARCRPALDEIVAASGGRLRIVEGDALSVDWRALAATLPVPPVIVANLPYNIATQLLIGWLESEPWPPWYAGMVLMFQKEVVDRLVAVPRTKDYGRLSVLAQHVCEVRRLFDVAPSAFVPPPKVISSVAQLTPRPAGDRLGDLAPLEKVTAAAFGQRRKMLRGSLSGLFGDPTSTLEGLGLSPTARAEELAVGDFVRLAGVLINE